jgi:hypothetical protein
MYHSRHMFVPLESCLYHVYHVSFQVLSLFVACVQPFGDLSGDRPRRPFQNVTFV